ncbi:hypothetical protein MNBD_GAMMA09-724 [hydrothermal vent metagenome]|uniref:Metallo-beta-lactamase domain-containing protein n=1 Tax=hydrothermal vent metagenome TaxID=652676 RepID=A0A3B0XD25_9ZZZZ
MKFENITQIKVFIVILIAALSVIAIQAAKTVTKVDIVSEPTVENEWFKIAENIYQFRYQHHYTLFVTTSNGVVAFDPLSDEAAEHYVKAIKQVAPGQPLIAIIYTHWHIDHSSGARVLMRAFGDHIPVIAHERTLLKLKRWNDPDIVLPTKLIGDKGEALRFGNMDIELNYIGYGHTDTLLVARFPGSFFSPGLVFVVDFANNDAVGWQDLPGWYLGELIAMQQRLLKLDFDIVAFGHGLPGDKSTIRRQTGYYLNLITQAKLVLQQGLTEDEAVTHIAPRLKRYSDWRFYNKWFHLNIRGAYRWAQGIKDKA